MVTDSLHSERPHLIPRDVLFGNPDRTSPSLSPDGSRLAWLASDPNNVLQVWMKTVGKDDEKIVTADKKRGIQIYFWAKNNRTLLYLQDHDGDENHHLYGVDLSTGNMRDFTPFEGVQVSNINLSPDFPDTALVWLNARDASLFDVYRLDLRSGALKLDTQNPGDVAGWAADAKFSVRLAHVILPNGGVELRLRASDQLPWTTFLKAGPEDILEALDFTADGESLYLKSSIGRDTAAVIRKRIDSGAEEVIAASNKVDVDEVMIHPNNHVVEAVAFSPGRTIWQAVDATVKEDFAALVKLNSGDFLVLNRTESDDVWLVGYTSDRGPRHFYRWNRKGRQGTFLFSSQPKLDGLNLAEMQPVVISTRDGLKMNSYLTLPPGVPARNLPMVLYPHGGPWARDKWGYNFIVQWLANRGYVVLQPNFRGSTGYGKKFLNAGNKQWGLKMHEDLIDAVDWALQTGLVDSKRIGIFGGSYGGYCALAALTFTSEVFACAVDVVGPSNLKTFIASTPPYWKLGRPIFNLRTANIDDPRDAQLIHNVSPLNFADKIVRPLLIAHGANDPRVKQAESEQIVDAILKNQGSVSYVLYPDEGHDFVRPENVIDFTARAEVFLGQHLGGRAEPMDGERIPGSTAVVRVIDNNF